MARDVYLIMPKKKRVNLYLTAELHDRLIALSESVPGMTASGIVDDLLEEFLPVVEALANAAKSGDRDAQAQMMSSLLADQFLALASEGIEAVRHTMDADGSGKGKSI